MPRWNSCKSSQKFIKGVLLAQDLLATMEPGETEITEQEIWDDWDESDVYEWLELGWSFEWDGKEWVKEAL